MPISAVDAITPAFQHARQQLLQPFRAGQWAKLGLVGMLAGEMTSGGGGCNPGSFQIPTTPNHSQRFMEVGLAGVSPMLYVSLIAVLMVTGLVLLVLFLYVNSVMRFILFDSVLAKECRIRESWSRRQGPGRRYFVWQILLFLSWIAGLTILIGIPAGFAFVVGWLRRPKGAHDPADSWRHGPVFYGDAVRGGATAGPRHDQGFRGSANGSGRDQCDRRLARLWPQIQAEKGSYAGYIGMKIVMAIGAAVVLGVVSAIVILLFLIPAGGLGAVAVIAGMAAGLTWNLYTITLAVVAGSCVILLLLYVISLISVPAVVFFPAYAIHFFASRYPALDALLHPAPPPPVISSPPPEPPPLPPAPEPIG